MRAARWRAHICLLENEFAFSFSFVVSRRVNRRAQNTFRVEINLDAHQRGGSDWTYRYACSRRVIFCVRHARNPLILGAFRKNSARTDEKRHQMDANALVGQCWLGKRGILNWISLLNYGGALSSSWRSFFLKARLVEIFITKLGKLINFNAGWISCERRLSVFLAAWLMMVLEAGRSLVLGRRNFYLTHTLRKRLHLMILRQTPAPWVICWRVCPSLAQTEPTWRIFWADNFKRTMRVYILFISLLLYPLSQRIAQL